MLVVLVAGAGFAPLYLSTAALNLSVAKSNFNAGALSGDSSLNRPVSWVIFPKKLDGSTVPCSFSKGRHSER